MTLPGQPDQRARTWRTTLRRSANALTGLLRRATPAAGPEPSRGVDGLGGSDADPYSYAPVDDEHADPGEVVWAWVPFEEDPKQGKDRPVLIIGRSQGTFLALQLTSKDHDRDSDQEAAEGRFWIDIGSGDWDRQRRPSEARVNRLLHLDTAAVRRTGARLDQELFEQVVAQVRHFYPHG